MMSSATKVKGQGVGSAYLEQVKLVREGLADSFDVHDNAPIGKVKADITHYHTIDLKFYLGRRQAAKNGITLGYVHMLPETVENSLRLPRFAKKIFYRYMIKFYKKMDRLVTVNPYFIGELERYGVDRELVSYIPNFVSTDGFFPMSADEKRKAKEKFGVPADRFTVVSAGQLQKRKGAFDFLEMARRLPDVNFVWAGGFSFGKITDGYKELSAAMENPPPNVYFLGIVDRSEMNSIYNMADVMLLASFEELFPMTILEAMCVNMPILLRDIDIYENILFDFYYKAVDVDGFVSVISKLQNDAEYYKTGTEMSKKGNLFYSKDKITQQWGDLYTSLYELSSQKKSK